MAAITALGIFVQSGELQAAQTAKPNVVFFLVDDFGWRALSSMGSTFHETPNIDKLAKSGMSFSNGYAACTVCSPSRAAILTGCYPGRTHLTDWIAGHKKPYNKRNVPDWNMKMDHERIVLSIRCVGNYLNRWGFTPQKPIKRAYEQQPNAVKKWLDEQYPEIEQRASIENAKIHWGDETAVMNTDVWGRSYFPAWANPRDSCCMWEAGEVLNDLYRTQPRGMSLDDH